MEDKHTGSTNSNLWGPSAWEMIHDSIIMNQGVGIGMSCGHDKISYDDKSDDKNLTDEESQEIIKQLNKEYKMLKDKLENDSKEKIMLMTASDINK